MTGNLRLLPVALVLTALLFGVKAGDVLRGANRLLDEFAVSPAIAQEAGAAAPAEGEAAPQAPAAPPAAARRSQAAGVQQVFTPAEIDMLQNLAQRREELNARAREMDLRENLLAVTEQRIEERIAELSRIEETIRGLLVQHDEQMEAQLQSVVAIYAAMKPGDAATIFNTLDMEILLDIAERMKERTMAPILASMDAAVADRLTVELATRRSLPAFGAAAN